MIGIKVIKSSSVSESIKITRREKNIGAIFGNKGNQIAYILLRSGAVISISKYVKTQINQEVVITGRHHSMIVVKALINIRLDQQQAFEGHRSQQSDHTEQDIIISKSNVTATVTMITRRA